MCPAELLLGLLLLTENSHREANEAKCPCPFLTCLDLLLSCELSRHMGQVTTDYPSCGCSWTMGILMPLPHYLKPSPP